MAALDTTSLDITFKQIKDYLIGVFAGFPGAGKVWNRIRYANDYAEWLQIAALQRDSPPAPSPIVLRAIFVYLIGFSDSRSGKNVLIQPTYGIEVIQGYEDGTDEANSTITFEGFLAKALDHFISDLYLGFTEGTEVTHTGLQGEQGDGRPEIIDGVLAHRKVLTLQSNFSVCK